MPESYRENSRESSVYYRDYLNTYVEKDLREMLEIKKSKRHIKSPKIYFTEIGLASYLLGIETENQANRDPLRGNLFENLIVSEILKSRLNENKTSQLYYMRTEKGIEIDLILKKEDALYLIEIKTSMTPNRSFSKHLLSFVDAEENTKNPKIIYTGQFYPQFNGVEYVNFKDIKNYQML